MMGYSARPVTVRSACTRLLLGVAVFAVLLGSAAFGGPVGEEVVHGTARFERDGNLTTVEASHNSIINYQSFDIAQQETVRFVQPSALARVLNRIGGAAPTQIDGTLQANGQVYFVNPAGVYFGQGAVVDVGAIYAAAGNIRNEDFLGGINRFVNLNGEVINWGAISASSIGLFGKHVANYGSIIAPEGMVAMVAGDEVLLGTAGGQIMVKVQGGGEGEAAVENVGQIMAAKGSVLLGAGDMLSLAVRNTGTIKAADITIEGGAGSTVEVAGVLDASSAEGAGGTVKVLADKVAVDNATIDASGATGGGTVLIGGGYQGKADLRNATATYVGRNAGIKADALLTGGGGTVVVWADGTTVYGGSISATGAAGGAGGLVEVSGKQQLVFRGAVATGGGSLLLDPLNISIINGSGGAEDGELPNIVAGQDPGATYTISEQALEAIAADTDISLAATQAINISLLQDDHTLGLATGAGNTVTFTAGTNFTMNAIDSISTQGGAIVIIAANDLIVGGIASNGGDITLAGNANVHSSLAIDAGAGQLAVTTDTVWLDGAVTANGGITIQPFSPNTTIGLASGSGTLNLDAGELAALNSTSTVTIGSANADAMTIADAGGIDLSGAAFDLVLTASSITTATNALNVGANDLTMNANAMAFGAAVTGTGDLLLQPRTAGLTIAIGDQATGTLALSEASIGNLTNGWNSITIGNAAAGNVDIQDAGGVTFNDPLSVVTGADITVDSLLTGADNASITLDGPGATTTLNANIVTVGNAILISDAVIVGTPALVTLDTTNGGGAAGGDDITIVGTIEDDGNPSGLVLNSGTGGGVELQANVGGVTPLLSLTATGASVSVQSVTTTAAQLYTGATDVDGSLNGVNITFNDAATFTGAGDQVVEAGGGTLDANATLTKTTAGNLTLGGDTAIDLVGTVDVDAGNLVIQDAFTAAADLLASGDVTLQGAGTLDGAVDQRIDAEAGTLTAVAITKNAAGTLTLGGGTLIDLNATVDNNAGALVIEDAFNAAANLLASTDVTLEGAGTLDGAVDQRIDAEAGTLTALAITKDAAGALTLGGGTAIDLNGTVDNNAGSLTIEDAFSAAADLLASTDVTLQGAGILDGAVAQRIDAEAGTLTAVAITKNAAGALTLGGGTAINLNGTVDNNNGALVIEDAFSAAANLLASTDVTLQGAATLNGAVDQRIDAEAGTLTALAITKNAAGTLTLGGATAINLNGTVDNNNGALVIEDAFSAAANLLASTDVTLQGAATLNGAVDQRIDAEAGTLTTLAITKNAAGALTLGGATAIDLNGTVDNNAGSLTIEDAFNAAADLLASTDVTLQGAGTLDGAVDQRIDAEAGTLTALAITKNAAGALTLGGGTAIDLNGTVDNNAGSLTIEDAFSAAANLLASTDVTLSGVGTLDGAVDQRIDAEAGSLLVAANLTKTAAGNLTVAGAIELALDGTFVDVDGGNLIVEDDLVAEAAQILASGDVTFQGTADFDMDGVNVLVDAEGGTLHALGTVSKTGTGNLSLQGTTAIDIDGAITVASGTLTVGDGGTTDINVVNATSTGAQAYTGTGTITLEGTTYQTTTAGGLTFTGAVDLAANVAVTAAGGVGNNIQFTSTIDEAFSLTANAGAGNVTLGGAVGTTALTSTDLTGANVAVVAVTTTGSQSYTADGLTIGGNLTGGGTLTIVPMTGGQAKTIGIGDNAAAADIALTETNVETNFVDGWTQILIGNAATGAIEINDAGTVTFNDPVVITSGTSITVNDPLVGAGDASITLDGPGATTYLNDNTTTAGTDILISDSVVIGEGLDITLSTGGGATGGVQIDGTINGVAGGGNETLTITAGNGVGTGQVTLAGAVQSDIETLTVTAADVIDLNDVTTGGAMSFTATTRIDLNGATYTAGGAATFAGAVDLALVGDTVTVTSGGGADIDFQSTIDGAKNLVANAGTGDMLADNAAIGGTTPLTSTDFTGAAVSVLAVTTTGDQTYTTNALTLGGGAASITGGGTLTFEPAAVGDNIDVGHATAGALQITDAMLTALTDGWTSIVIGYAAGTGTIDVETATFTDPVTIQSPVGGTIDIDGLTATDLAIVLNAGTGTLGAATVAAGAGTIVATADTIDVDGVWTANGGITVQPGAATRTIALNDATGDFELSLAELQNLDTTGTLIIGASGGSGAVAVGSAGQLDFSAAGSNEGWTQMTLRGGNITFTDIDADGLLILPDDATFRVEANDLTGQDGTNVDLRIGGANGTAELALTGTLTNFLMDVANLGDSTITGNLNITRANQPFTFNGTVAVTGDITVDLGTGLLTVAGPVSATNMYFTSGGIGADGIAINDTLTGSGDLLLRPSTNATTIGIGDGAAGDYNLTNAELDNIVDGWNSVTIGFQNGTGAGDVHMNAYTYNDPLIILSNADVYVDGQLTGAGDASFTLNGGGATTYLNANIVTPGTPISIPDSVVVGSTGPYTITLDTTSGGTVPAGEGISITGIVNDGGNASSLILNGGTGGGVNLAGLVGGVTPLTALTVTNSGQTDLVGVTTTGAQSYTSLGHVLHGGSYSSNTAGAIAFVGQVDIDTGAVAVTTAGGAGDDISFSAAIDGPQTLTLNAGALGTITLDGAIGATTPVTGFTVTNAAQLDVNAAIDIAGNGSITAAVANLAAPITFTGLLTGAVPTSNISGTGLIQNGIDIADDPGTINVADGTYTENLIVNKPNITLQSVNGSATTILQAAAGVGMDLWAGADGFTLGGSADHGFSIDSGAATTFLVQLANAPTDVTISYNDIDTTGNATMGVSIGAAGATGLTIDNNAFTAESGNEGSIWGPKVVDVTVSNNTFIVPGGPGASGYAVQFCGVTGASTITGNDIDGYSMGVVVTNGPGTTGLTISNNTIQNCNQGMRFAYENVTADPDGDLTGVTIQGNVLTDNTTGIKIDSHANILADGFTINQNSFTGGTLALDNDDPQTADASVNWWGINTPDGVAARIQGTVDYSPWLDTGTDGDGGTAGFQGTFDVLHVDDDSAAQATPRIQEAIDLINPAGTINVYDGTYTGDLAVAVADLTIQSATGRDNTTIQLDSLVGIDLPAAAAGFTLGGAADSGFTVLSGATTTFLVELGNSPNNVTISHNAFNTTGNASQGISIGAAGATGLTIANNTFTAENNDGSIWGPEMVDVTVDTNVFTVPGGPPALGYAVQFSGVTGTSTITANEITGYANGILISNGEATSGLAITNNTLTTCTNGIRFAEYVQGGRVAGDMTTVAVTGNTMDTCAIGLLVGNGAHVLASNFTIQYNTFTTNAVGLRSDHDTEVVALDHNDFSGSTTFAVQANGAAAVNAENNWWNSVNGPEHDGNTFNKGFQGDPVSDNVDYVPWLNALSATGVSFAPVTNLNDSTTYSSIQAAITAAAAGDVLEASNITGSPATYTEDLLVNTANLTVQSTNGSANTTIQLVDGVGIGLAVGADGFTLGGTAGQGFTVDSGAATSFLVEITNGSSDVTISHNIFDTTGNASQGISVGAAGATGLDINNNQFTAELGDGSIWGPALVDLTVDNNTFTGPGATPASGYAIEFSGVTGTSAITNNIVTDYANGIFILNGTGTTGLTIDSNVVTGCTNGLRFMVYPGEVGDMTGLTITNNTVTHADAAAGEGAYGMRIGAGANIQPTTWTITGNTFNFSQMQFQDGTDTLDLAAVYGDNGATAGNTFNQAAWADTGITIWYDIQDAIDDAASPDTVNVGEGTYVEDLTIDKADLTLRSVLARADTILQGVAGVHIDLQAGADNAVIGGVAGDGFTIESGATTSFLVQLTNAPSGVTISHNILDTTGNASMGVSVGAAGATGLTIDQNTFTIGDGGDGAIWAPSVVDFTVTTNDFNGPGKDAAGGGYAVQTQGATGTSLIDSNTIDDVSLGIVVLSGNGGTTGLTITNNTVNACNQGLYFYDAGAGLLTGTTVGGVGVGNTFTANTNGVRIRAGANIDTTGLTIDCNDFTGNTVGLLNENAGVVTLRCNRFSGNTTYAVNNTGAAELDGQYNWWGDATGPDDDGDLNPHTGVGLGPLGDKVSANVDFMPWLATNTVCILNNTERVYVEHDFGSGYEVIAWSDTIQPAIDAAVPGQTPHDRVVVTDDGIPDVAGAATYVEDLVINKSNINLVSEDNDTITLQGVDGVHIDLQAGADNAVIGGVAGDGFTVESGAATTFLVQLTNAPSDVTISYNAFDTTGNATQGISVGAAGADNLTIDHNAFIAEAGDGSIWGPKVSNSMVSNNTFTGPNAGGGAGYPGSGYAVQFSGITDSTLGCNIIDGYALGIVISNGEGTDNLDIVTNTLTNNRIGVYFFEYSPTPTNGHITDMDAEGDDGYGQCVKVANNIFDANDVGLQVAPHNVAYPEDLIDASQIHVYQNSFTNHDTWAVWNEDVETLNASVNWWGSNDPADFVEVQGDMGAATPIPGGIHSTVVPGAPYTTNVDYTPWIDVGTNLAGGGACGFTPNLDVLHVDDNSPQTPSVYGEKLGGVIGRLQEGHHELNSSGTLKVHPGTYDNDVDPCPLVTTKPFTMEIQGDVVVQGPVDLGANLDVTSTGTHDLTFNQRIIGTTDGGAKLDIALGAGDLTFTDEVGAAGQRLASLTAGTTGNIVFQDGDADDMVSVSTTGNAQLGTDLAFDNVPQSALIWTQYKAPQPQPIGSYDNNTVTVNLDVTSANGNVALGRNHKLTTGGDLTLSAPNGTVTVTDVNAGTLTFNANRIEVYRRPRADVLRADGTTYRDFGPEIIVTGGANDITYNAGATWAVLGTAADGRLPIIATAAGPPSSFPAGFIPGILLRRPGAAGPELVDGAVLDLVAVPVIADFASVLAGALPKAMEEEVITEEVRLTPALKELLQQLGIWAKDVEEGGTRIYDDVVAPNQRPTVTAMRLQAVPTEKAVELYRKIFWKGSEYRAPYIKGILQKALDAYRTKIGADKKKGVKLDPLGFRRFLETTPAHAEALAIVNQIGELFKQLSLLGLNDREQTLAEQILVRDICPRGMSAEELIAAIKGGAK